MVFVIECLNNESSYKFQDIELFLKLLKPFHFDRFIAEEPITESIIASQLRKNYAGHSLAYHGTFQHTLWLKFQCELSNDVYLFSNLFQSFCQIAGYTFELASKMEE